MNRRRRSFVDYVLAVIALAVVYWLIGLIHIFTTDKSEVVMLNFIRTGGIVDIFTTDESKVVELSSFVKPSGWCVEAESDFKKLSESCAQKKGPHCNMALKKMREKRDRLCRRDEGYSDTANRKNPGLSIRGAGIECDVAGSLVKPLVGICRDGVFFVCDSAREKIEELDAHCGRDDELYLSDDQQSVVDRTTLKEDRLDRVCEATVNGLGRRRQFCAQWGRDVDCDEAEKLEEYLDTYCSFSVADGRIRPCRGKLENFHDTYCSR